MRTIALIVALLALAACAPKDDSAPLSDSRAETYRMFYDSSPGDFQARHFIGQIRMSDTSKIFPPAAQLPRNTAGNAIAEGVLVDGHVWSAVYSPGLDMVNVVTESPDGSISSAFDLDADGIADVIDMRLADDRRYSIANSRGLAALAPWLQGQNPLCRDLRFSSRPATTGFGCDQAGGGGGRPGDADLTGIADPFAAICAQYRNQPARPSGGVMAHGPHGYGGRRSIGGLRDLDAGDDGLRVYVVVQIYSDDAGNHVSTYRDTYYYDSDHGNYLTRVVRERVDHEGKGTRTVIDYDEAGTATSRSEDIEVEMNDDGTYPVDNPTEDRDTPESHRGTATGGPTWPPNMTTPTDPGPIDDAEIDDWALWCEATDSSNHVSGVEAAAATDFSVFRDPICLTGDPDAGDTGNCIDVESARPGDFRDILDAPAPAGGCGDFEQPGPDGTCGPKSGLEKLKGGNVWLASAKLGDVEICNPLVCR